VPESASDATEAVTYRSNEGNARRLDPMRAHRDVSSTIHGSVDGARHATHPVAASSAAIAGTSHGGADISGHPSDTTHFTPDTSDSIGGDGNARPDGTRHFRARIDAICVLSGPSSDGTRQYLARVRS